jgi:integrase
VLRALLKHAVDQDMIDVNPVLGIKKLRSRGDGFHTWTWEEFEQFKARHPADSKARLALYLLYFTGQRRGDVIRMGLLRVNNDEIAVRQEKNGEQGWITMDPDLVEGAASDPEE